MCTRSGIELRNSLSSRDCALEATDLSVENESNGAFDRKVCIQYSAVDGETGLLTLVAMGSAGVGTSRPRKESRH